MFSLGMVSTNLFMLFRRSMWGDTEFKLPKAANGKVFFVTSG